MRNDYSRFKSQATGLKTVITNEEIPKTLDKRLLPRRVIPVDLNPCMWDGTGLDRKHRSGVECGAIVYMKGIVISLFWKKQPQYIKTELAGGSLHDPKVTIDKVSPHASASLAITYLYNHGASLLYL